jgi:conjugative transfer signal peptidase TraF
MRDARSARWIIAGAIAAGALVVASSLTGDIVLWNGSPSLPVGFYRRLDAPVGRGAIVTVRAAAVAPVLAEMRGFTDPGDRFLKRVAGVAGDRVCAHGAVVTLNGHRQVERRRRDSAGRALPSWEGCLTLAASQVFLLGDTADSFDGRYWGPTSIDAIEGRWRPL